MPAMSYQTWPNKQGLTIKQFKMKKLLILLFMLGVTTANAQYYYIMYVSVKAEHACLNEKKWPIGRK